MTAGDQRPGAYRPAPRNLQVCPWTVGPAQDFGKVEGWLRARQDWRDDVGSPLPPLNHRDATTMDALEAMGRIDPAVAARERAAVAAPVEPARSPGVVIRRG